VTDSARAAGQPRADRVLLGLALRALSVLMFAALSAMVKIAGERHANLYEILFFRQTFALPLILTWIAGGPGLRSVATRRIGAHISRATIGLGGMVTSFAAVQLLPLAEATTLQFTVPIFATITAALLLREPTGWHRWGAVLVGFVGVLVSLYLFHLQPHDPGTWALLVAIGLIGGAGQLAMTSSFRVAPVSAVVSMDYTALIWGTLFGWLLFAAIPGPTTWIGAAIIIASGAYIAHREHRMRDIAPAANE
jgi:drug/metabolite transporter (DMT)-like permease